MIAKVAGFLFKSLERYIPAPGRTVLRYFESGVAHNLAWAGETLPKTGVLSLEKSLMSRVPEAMEVSKTGIAEIDDVAARIAEVLKETQITTAGTKRFVRGLVQDESGKIRRVNSVRKSGEVQGGYYPRSMPEKRAHDFIEQTEQAFEFAKNLGAKVHQTPMDLVRNTPRVIDEASAPIVNKVVEDLMRNGRFSDDLMDALNYRLSKGDNAATALLRINERAAGQIYDPIGMMKYAREETLPRHLYEQNPVRALTTYFQSWARAKAQIDAFGPKWEKWEAAINQMTPDQAQKFLRATAYVTGRGLPKTAQGWRKFSEVFTKTMVFGKIGLGTATLPNFVQTLYSTWPKVGTYRFFEGTVKYLTSSKQRAMVRSSGVLARGHTALELFAGDIKEVPNFKALMFDLEGAKAYEKILAITNFGVMTPFNAVNRMNNSLTASIGEGYIRGLYKSVNRGSIWAKKNRAILERLEIRPDEPLTSGKLLNGMYNFTMDMQLQRNVLADPIWFNDPRFRMLALFKRFPYRTIKMVKDQIIKEEFMRGNVMPLLRLGAGGLAGGAFVGWSKRAIQRGLGDDPDKWDDGDKSIGLKLLYMAIPSGMLGGVTDLVRGVKGKNAFEDAAKVVANLGFSMSPVLVSEFAGTPASRKYTGWFSFGKEMFERAAKEDDFPAGVESLWEAFGEGIVERTTPLGGMLMAGKKEQAKKKDALMRYFKKQYMGATQ